ncbi:MAG: FTR1 family protein [Anaerolineae bacterium]
MTACSHCRILARATTFLTLLALALALAWHASPALADPPPLRDGLKAITQQIDNMVDRLPQGSSASAQADYKSIHDAWAAIEDGVKAQSPDAYEKIEDHLRDLKAATRAEPYSAARIGDAAHALDESIDDLLAALPAAAVASGAAASAPGDATAGMVALNDHIEKALDGVAEGNREAAQAEFRAFTNGWAGVEDGVRAASQTSYLAIEDAMGDARAAFATQPFDAARVKVALQALETQNEAFIGGRSAGQGVTASAVGAEAGVAGLVATLDTAIAQARSGDAAASAATLAEFKRAWPVVETSVAARSPSVYASTEDAMARAYGLLESSPPSTNEALSVMVAMRGDLAPLASTTQYGVFDAAIIMLREGLEALLVMAALLAFLNKSGNGGKSNWIWLGGAVGIAASIVTAVIVQQIFAGPLAGANREVIEGVVGLVAAGLLVYVSYWMHRKSQIGAWQHYIRAKSSSALARNSLLGLALIAFLAVYREGAETVIFYMGVAPSISLNDLLMGVAVGVAVLVVLGILMLRFGLRIPLRPFFLVTSILLYYMAFKFVGMGLHSLQVAGVIPATSLPYLPTLGPLGVFPTIETSVVQLVLLALTVAVVVFLWLRQRHQGPLRASQV